MKQILLILLLILTQGEGENMKPKINFHKDGKLMWLIDTTENNKRHSMRTIESMQKTDPDLVYKSYENYLNHVNSHKEYKYNNWRIPTLKELLRLEQKDTFFARLFASKEQKKSQICIDTEIFYDHKIRHVLRYWTSDTCTSRDVKEGYISVSFSGLRFDPKSYGKAMPGWGIRYGCLPKYGKLNLRLVRDVK